MADRNAEDVPCIVVSPKAGRKEMTWTVYGLIDPRDNTIFYIGMTINLRQRMSSHKGDSASSAWHRCKEIEDHGLSVSSCVFAICGDKDDARLIEGRLILTLPDLCNKKTAHGLPSIILHPDWHVLDRPKLIYE